MYWELAFKNILRNKGRTCVTVAAIAVGCVSLIVAGGFIRGAISELQESYIRAFLGHIQVYQGGFSEKGATQPYDFMLRDSDELMRRISSAAEVQEIAPRIEFFGLVSAGENALPCTIQGVDPRREISPLLKMVSGKNLAGNDGYEVILGAGLAKALHAQTGQSLTLLTTTPSGAFNGLDVKVTGVFRSGTKIFDDKALRLPIKTAQKLLRAEGIQRLIIFLRHTEATDRMKEDLVRLLAKDYPNIEIMAWHELDDADFAGKLVNFYDRLFLVFKIIIIVVVILSVFNTMNMSILERTGEIGTLLALGLKRDEVLAIFLREGLILGLLGAVLGLSAGCAVARLLNHVGVSMGVPPSMTIEWIARFPIVPGACAFALVQAVATTILSCMYPAWKSSRLEISEALRHNV